MTHNITLHELSIPDIYKIIETKIPLQNPIISNTLCVLDIFSVTTRMFVPTSQKIKHQRHYEGHQGSY